MSKRPPFGPQLPASAGERDVWRDYLLERNFPVPWEIKMSKPTKVRGSALASRAAGLMAKLAEAQAALANMDTQRMSAELTVESAEKELEGMGVDSLRTIRNIDSRREYRVCQHPDCERFDMHSWRDEVDPWLCDGHEDEEVKSHEDEEVKSRKAEESRALLASLKTPKPESI